MLIAYIGIGFSALFTGYLMFIAPKSKWFQKLNSFESTTTLEDIIEDVRKEDNEY